MLRVGPVYEAFTPGSWVLVSGQATQGYSETFEAAPVWVVNHNLGRVPAAVSVRTLGGVTVDVNVTHLNSNQCVAYFDVPIAGRVEIV